MFGVARPAACSARHSSKVRACSHVGEQQILRVGDAHLAEAVSIGQIREQIHLGVGGVAGRAPSGFFSEMNTAR